MRPTGKLHLGNYMGALYNWVKLQEEYECYFFIADYHALTTDYADTSKVQQEHSAKWRWIFWRRGLDPKKSTIFVQSKVPAHFELNDLLGMITPLSWLETGAELQGSAGAVEGERTWRRLGFWGIRCCSRRTFWCTSRTMSRWDRIRRRMWS